MSTVSSVEGLRAISLEELKVSVTGSQAERRRHFDKAAIDDLAKSIKEVGLLSPIIARPVNGHFEVVAGERRFIAAKKAGLSVVNVSVRELTDEQVLEIQLVENLQREGLHELAEAEGYESLQKLGHTANEIADKVGKSKAYVYGRMKLLALCAEARNAFYDNRISASIALLLARIPVEDLQIKALSHILRPNNWDETPLSYRDALRYVHDEFTLRLADAPFPRDDAELVPAAGACGACPKRTGNQPELFGDIKGADVCTDPSCFKAKRAAWNKVQLTKAKESGQTVITGAEARKVQSKYSSHLQGYVRPSDKCPDDPKKRTYAQLLGKADVPRALLQNPDTGKFSPVIKTADAAKILKDQGIKVPHVDPSPSTQNNGERIAERAKRKTEFKFRVALFAAVMDAAPAKLGRVELELIAQNCEMYFDEEVQRIIGIPNSKPMSSHVKTLTDVQLAKLLFGMAIGFGVDEYGDGKDLLAAAKRYDVDPAKIRKSMAQSAAPAEAKPAKSPKKAK
jgi:ParB/RepB/Spo0J family partition protein